MNFTGRQRNASQLFKEVQPSFSTKVFMPFRLGIDLTSDLHKINMTAKHKLI